MQTIIPGLKAGHQKITPECRHNRGLQEAFDEADARLRKSYLNYAAAAGNEDVTWHLALVRDETEGL
ncbi:MAG: hypothetical protein NUV75_00610 [Gallionella sp.]|nr:hypothetical protein [Gallionella sp.]